MQSFEKNTHVIGIDIGGSHITAALVDVENKVLVPNTTVRRHVNAHASADEIIGNWSATIEDVRKYLPKGSTKIGIAMPGPFDYANGVCLMQNVNKYDALYGMNIKESLSEQLSVTPTDISMRNDAEAFLKGEVMCGAAQGFNRVIGITLGTGLGSARHAEGQTEDVAMGINTPFLEGVAEDYISTRWFVKRYHELTGKNITGAKDITDLRAKDPFAEQVYAEFCTNLLAFLGIFIELEQPEIVIIGGNIALALQEDLSRLEVLLQKKYPYVLLRKAQFGEDAALIGAAYS